MLPDDVKIVEGDEKGIIPPTPRFQILDDRLINGRQQLYLFAARVLAGEELVSAQSDGKLSVFWSEMTVALGERVDQKIEAAPQTIDDSTNLGIVARRFVFDPAGGAE
jgi:hypothetical protein